MNIASLLVEYVTQNRKAVADYVNRNLDWSSGDGEQVMEEYRNDMDLDDEDEDGDHIEVDMSTPEFESWFERWVEGQYGEAEWYINEGLRSGKITLYRCITAPEDWTPDPNRHAGVYWTWDKQAASAHWGDFNSGHIKWMLETEVIEDAIDWVATLGQNAMPCYAEEKEVRLKEGRPVTITAYYPK